MADLETGLREMLEPLRAEYQGGCLNRSGLGQFDRILSDMVEESLDLAGPEHEYRDHLLRLHAIFAEYRELDLATRAKRLREAKRRLDAMLGTRPSPDRARLEPVRLPRPSRNDLTSSVQYFKGVGPQRAKLLARLGIETIGDLLFHFPRRHEDRSQMRRLREAFVDDLATFQGVVREVDRRRPRGNLSLVKAWCVDETGGIDLVWFNQPWVADQLKPGQMIIFSGRVQSDRYGRHQIVQPTWEPLEAGGEPIHTGRWVPIYPLTEGLTQTTLRRWIHGALEQHADEIREQIPDWVREQQRLGPRHLCVKAYHFPANDGERIAARRRLVFEEFFGLQVALAQRRYEYRHRGHGIAFVVDSPLVGRLLERLPFELTGAQAKVLDEIRADLAEPTPMNRLLQGDVGSGKTLVALAAMLTVVDNGYQAALMVPTEILAEQHHRVIRHWCEPLGVTVDLFTGRAGERQRRESQSRLSDGSTQIAVGTQALIQSGIDFDSLGLVVIDEQHRFGVMQRAGLTRKGTTPDVLVMTATPIPRTLALTVYGDLDTSVIDEMPAGRPPIATEWVPLSGRQALYSRVKQRLREGRQAYFVCPLVEESESLEDVEAVTSLHEHLLQHFGKFRVGLIHGRLKSAEKDEQMTRFRAGDIDLLAATTVIEVGIDVPNATVMVIVNADRFGLAQLHQLRGRVGRGRHESQCYLLTDAKYNPELTDDESGLQYRDARARMRFMVQYSDGFKLAEADLELRGPGELGGTRQSGVMDLHVAHLSRDEELLALARETARELIERDPRLAEPAHTALAAYVRERFVDRGRLAEVG